MHGGMNGIVLYSRRHIEASLFKAKAKASRAGKKVN